VGEGLRMQVAAMPWAAISSASVACSRSASCLAVADAGEPWFSQSPYPGTRKFRI
jgi:hypothetical protein